MTPKKSWEVSVNLVQESLKKNWKLSVDQKMNATFQVIVFLAKKEIELGGKKNPAYINLEKQIAEYLAQWDGKFLVLDVQFTEERRAVLKQTPPIKEAVFTPSGNEGFPGKERRVLPKWEPKKYPLTKEGMIDFLADQTPEVQALLQKNIWWRNIANYTYPEGALCYGKLIVEIFSIVEKDPSLRTIFWGENIHILPIQISKHSSYNNYVVNDALGGGYGWWVSIEYILINQYYLLKNEHGLQTIPPTKINQKFKSGEVPQSIAIKLPEFNKALTVNPQGVLYILKEAVNTRMLNALKEAVNKKESRK